MTAEGLRHFYDTFYWPNNATVSIIGDFERGEALRLVEAHFGKIPAAPAPIPEVYTDEPEQRGERWLAVRQAGQLGSVMVAYKSPAALEADADALDVLSVVLATGKNSRLYRRLTDQGLTTHVFASASRFRDPGLFYVLAMLAPERTHEEVEGAVGEALAEIIETGITEAELTRAKSQIRAEEAFSRDGPFAVAGRLNEAIAAGDWKLYPTYLERINRVTCEAVQRVAREYLVDERKTVGHYIPTMEA